jgi:hypothetical protein
MRKSAGAEPADFALRKEERKNEKDEQQTYYLYNKQQM